MELIEGIIKRAQANPQRIVLAEGTEERTLKAADQIIEQGIAKLTLQGNKQEIESLAAQFGLKNISKATIIDPANNPNSKVYSDLLFKLRPKKGMTEEQKANYAALMKNMILADGVIEPSELLAYEDICKFCDIPSNGLDLQFFAITHGLLSR